MNLVPVAVNEIFQLPLRREGSWAEVTYNIPNMCGTVDALEGGKPEFPRSTEKEICCLKLC